ncbi:MAG: hypothetical protein IKE68_01425, partial [Solobacterium sp.]|nr:hypothetical protein [Solobacterium sp.]
MNKRVLLFVLPFLLLGCSRTETNQTEKEIIEANIRVKNEIVQYRDEDGTWKDLTTVEILQNLTAEEPVTDSREEVIISTGTNGTDGKAGTDGKEGQRGLQGIQGRTNGKDGTQVTIAEDGELLLDGKGTGYILWKKPGETSGSYNECASYHRENSDGGCGVCLPGYTEDEYGACRYTGGIGTPVKLVIYLERADWSVIKTQTETVIGGEEYSFSVPEELEGLHACYTKVTGTADIYSE